jgi:hypothetical protein
MDGEGWCGLVMAMVNCSGYGLVRSDAGWVGWLLASGQLEIGFEVMVSSGLGCGDEGSGYGDVCGDC